MLTTYVFAITNDKYNNKLIVVEETSRERAVQKAKAKVFPDAMTKGKRIGTIHNMFYEFGYKFENSLIIEGNCKITEIEK